MFSKLSTTVVLLLVLVNLAFSAVSRSQPSVHPGFIISDHLIELSFKYNFSDHPGKCWDEDTKSVHVVGDVFTVPKCTRVTCLGDLSFERAS